MCYCCCRCANVADCCCCCHIAVHRATVAVVLLLPSTFLTREQQAVHVPLERARVVKKSYNLTTYKQPRLCPTTSVGDRFSIPFPRTGRVPSPSYPPPRPLFPPPRSGSRRPDSRPSWRVRPSTRWTRSFRRSQKRQRSRVVGG